jgi:hypothetical protein
VAKVDGNMNALTQNRRTFIAAAGDDLRRQREAADVAEEVERAANGDVDADGALQTGVHDVFAYYSHRRTLWLVLAHAPRASSMMYGSLFHRQRTVLWSGRLSCSVRKRFHTVTKEILIAICLYLF